MSDDANNKLSYFQQKHDFFVGVDSDGCVFDSMEIKHKECFIPNIIKYSNLQPIAKYTREVAEFVNLYSQWRGTNRFPALVKVFDLLRKHPEVLKRGVNIPEVPSLKAFIGSGVPLGIPALQDAMEKKNDIVLKRTLDWCIAVNKTIEEIVKNVPPFPFVRESLERLSLKADIMVVSSTPFEALNREWAENNIAGLTTMIAGQEMGSKEEQIRIVTNGNYRADRILIIGDSPGDLEAARSNNALFYPIIPGQEVKSWEKFQKEIIESYFAGKYTPDKESEFVELFYKSLPTTPSFALL